MDASRAGKLVYARGSGNKTFTRLFPGFLGKRERGRGKNGEWMDKPGRPLPRGVRYAWLLTWSTGGHGKISLHFERAN